MNPESLRYVLMCEVNKATPDNPVGAVELCVQLGLLKQYINDRAIIENAKRDLRTLVNEAIEAGEEIGSVGDGYFRIRTWADKDLAIAHLKNQYQSISDRIKNIERNFERNHNDKQMELIP